MATRALQQVVSYIAWNTSTSAYVTGDAANHSLSWLKDGTRSATTNAAAEVDSTNLPGLYKCTMTATETDCIEGVLGGKSSTSNVILIPTMVAFDYLNTSAPATAGVPDVNVKNMNNVSASAITTVKAVQGLTTADTIATYTGNTPQTGDAYARLGAPAGASVSADVAAINAKTTNLPSAPAATGDAMTLTGGERNSVADALLGRNVAGGSSAGRLVKEALYVLRNKVDAANGIVYQVDDVTSAFTFSVTTAPGDPISVYDPA